MNPFEYIKQRITDIADVNVAINGRDPSWGYSDLMELLTNIEEAYNDRYGSSDTVYRSDAIEACHKDYDNILDFRSNGWTVASSFEEILNALPSVQPEHALKDCRNCKHGQYNDHWDTYFCYNSGNCEDWNLWESDIIPSAQSERKMCNLCKYYEGVHRVQGHAPCSFWKIGGVLYDDYCSRWEKFDE